jgi:hypothetical protein
MMVESVTGTPLHVYNVSTSRYLSDRLLRTRTPRRVRSG